eukprot:gene11033-12282_t
MGLAGLDDKAFFPRPRSTSFSSLRFKVLEKFTRFCQYCSRTYIFWLLVAVFTCLEPILCSQKPVRPIIGVATREWEKIVVIEAMSRLGTINIKNPLKDFTPLKLLVFFAAEGEYVLEGVMLLAGWILLFWRPGLATLRCFRVFRILWFYEVEVFRVTTMKLFSPLLGRDFIIRGFKVLKFAINALTALGNEMFRLTNETRGGLLLIMIFFYSAYVLGAALYVETNGEYEGCKLGISQCSWTLIRLTFFDGNGLDFAAYLTKKHRILFFIIMVYLCITAFGILNGLVGVFGTALARASHLAFEEDDEDYEEEDGGDSSIDDDDDDHDDGQDPAGRNEDNGRAMPRKFSVPAGGKAAYQEIGSDVEAAAGAGDDDDEEEEVEVYRAEDSPPAAPKFASIVNAAARQGNSSPTVPDHVRKNLKSLLRGKSSRFAIEHFTKQAGGGDEGGNGNNNNSGSSGGGGTGNAGLAALFRPAANYSAGGGGSGAGRPTMRDIARLVAANARDQRSRQQPADLNANSSSNEEILPNKILRPKPSVAPGGFANMFAVGGNGANRPIPNKSSRNLLHRMGGAGGSAATASQFGMHALGDNRALMSSMIEMRGIMENQTKMITALSKQVQHLSKQIAVLVPPRRNSEGGDFSLADDISVTSSGSNTKVRGGIKSVLTGPETKSNRGGRAGENREKAEADARMFGRAGLSLSAVEEKDQRIEGAADISPRTPGAALAPVAVEMVISPRVIPTENVKEAKRGKESKSSSSGLKVGGKLGSSGGMSAILNRIKQNNYSSAHQMQVLDPFASSDSDRSQEVGGGGGGGGGGSFYRGGNLSRVVPLASQTGSFDDIGSITANPVADLGRVGVEGGSVMSGLENGSMMESVAEGEEEQEDEEDFGQVHPFNQND